MTRSKTKKKSAELADDATFEAVLARLEELVGQLEQGELPLEDSLEAFEQGVALVRRASQSLDAMERRIEELTRDGSLTPLEEDEDAADGRGY